jgi:hypothetical protein
VKELERQAFFIVNSNSSFLSRHPVFFYVGLRIDSWVVLGTKKTEATKDKFPGFFQP